MHYKFDNSKYEWGDDMIGKILKKFKVTENIHIKEYIKRTDNILFLMALIFYFLLNLSLLFIKIVLLKEISYYKLPVDILTIVLLGIAIYENVLNDKRNNKIVAMAILLSVGNQIIFPFSNFYLGYFVLMSTSLTTLTILVFFYRLKDHNLLLLITVLASIYIYDLLYFKPLDVMRINDYRVMAFFLIVTIYIITETLKERYYKLICYTNQLMYRDSELGLNNQRELTHDLKLFQKNGNEIYLITIDFNNIDSLYYQNDYYSTNYVFKSLVNELNQLLEVKLYRLDKSIIAFIFKESQSIDAQMERIYHSLRKMINKYETDLTFQFIGTSCHNQKRNATDFINQIYQTKYAYNDLSNKLNNTKKVFWYDQSIIEKNEKLLMIENSIQSAIDSDDFEIYIQPKISLKVDNYYSGEVLSRWHHPTLGYISPYEFIPVIERKNLMSQFTQSVLRKSHKFLKEFQSKKNSKLYLSVNISSSLFRKNELTTILLKEIDKKYINQYSLEITEDIFFDLNEDNRVIMSSLRRQGYKLSVDDFGTGYSNFEYLQNLEIDILKIDKKFIDCLSKDKKSELIVKAMIEMSHALNIKVVAEGVENLKQLEILKELDCDEIQGYYYAKPLTTSEFLEYYK